MESVELAGGWSGILVAGGFVVALIAGLFLIQWAWRTWIRYRTGFGSARNPAHQVRFEEPPDEEALPQGGAGPSA